MEIINKKNIGSLESASMPKPQHNYLAQVFLVLIVAGLFFWFFVKPKAASMSLKKAQTAQLVQQKEDIIRSADKLKKMVDSLKNHSQDLDKLDEALPLEDTVLRLNILTKALASSAGVILNDANFSSSGEAVVAGNKDLLKGPFTVQRKVQPVEGSISVNGSYNNLEAFVKKIENNARLMDIQSLSVSGVDENILNLRIELKTYEYVP